MTVSVSRVSECLTQTLDIELVRNNMAARQSDLKLYLDVIDDPYSGNKVYWSNLYEI